MPFSIQEILRFLFCLFSGEIVAISLGSACLILVVGALVYWAWKVMKRRRATNSEYEKILPSKQQAKPQQHPMHHVVAGDKQQVHPEKSGPTLRYVMCVCVFPSPKYRTVLQVMAWLISDYPTVRFPSHINSFTCYGPVVGLGELLKVRIPHR